MILDIKSCCLNPTSSSLTNRNTKGVLSVQKFAEIHLYSVVNSQILKAFRDLHVFVNRDWFVDNSVFCTFGFLQIPALKGWIINERNCTFKLLGSLEHSASRRVHSINFNLRRQKLRARVALPARPNVRSDERVCALVYMQEESRRAPEGMQWLPPTSNSLPDECARPLIFIGI